MNLIFVNTNLMGRLKERILIFVTADATVRSLSSSAMLQTVVSKRVGGRRPSLRQLSPYYARVFRALRADAQQVGHVKIQEVKAENITLGKKLASKAEAIQIGSLGKLIATNLDDSHSLQMAIDSLENAVASSDKDRYASNIKDALINSVVTLWTKSHLLDLLMDCKTFSGDYSDPENVASFVETWEHLCGTYNATSFMNANASTFHLTNGTLGPNIAKFANPDYSMFNTFEITLLRDASEGKRARQTLLCQALVAVLTGDNENEALNEWRDDLESIYNYFHDINLIMDLRAYKDLYEDLIKSGSGPDSDNRDLNQLIKECERTQGIFSIRQFHALQPLIAMLQMSLAPLDTPGLKDYIKNTYPDFDITYKIDDLFSRLFALPIGETTSKLIDKFVVVDKAKLYNQITDVLELDGGAVQPEELINVISALYREVLPFLHSFLNNKKLMDMYMEGAAQSFSAKMTIVKQQVNFDDIEVRFSDMGTMTGDGIKNLDSLSYGANFGWGINKYNSSARTLIRWNDNVDKELLESYSYGEISYRSYINSSIKGFINWIKDAKNGRCASLFPENNVFMIPIRRTVPTTEFFTLSVDKNLIDLGPVSLLPASPQRIEMVNNSAKLITIKKKIVGKFETRIDQLPLEITTIARPQKNDDMKVENSMLAEALMIDRNTVVSGEASSSLLFQRFLDYDDNSLLACSAVTRDPLFIDMVNFAYLIPRCHVEPDIYLLYLGHAYPTRHGRSELQTKGFKKVPVRRMLVSTTTLGAQMADSRLLGKPTEVSSFQKTAQTGDEKPLHIETML